MKRGTQKEELLSNEGKTIALIRRQEEGADPNLWIQTIQRMQENDEEIQYKLRNFPQQCYMRDDLVRVQMNEWEHDKIIIPEKLTWRLIQWVHRLLLHYGTDKIASFADRYFTANNLARVVRDVVASCTICQATKYYTRPVRGVEYYELPEEPGRVVSIDIFGPLPKTRDGYKYILVTMDQFTKHTKFYPLRNQKLDSIMETLEEQYFAEVGIPQTILSDNGGQFITARWARFADRLRFEIRKTSPYNPQSNPVERVMRELGRIIRAYASHSHATWIKVIAKAERVINETVHASTGFTPNELQLDEDNNLGLPRQLLPVARYERTWQQKIEEASTNLKNAALKRKKQSDKHPERGQYQVGDLVWLKIHRRSDASRRLTRKIHLVYDGPYQILQIIRRNAYLLGTLEGEAVTSANSRQIKPHRIARLDNEQYRGDPRARTEDTSEGDYNGDEYEEADPEDAQQYQPEDSLEEPSYETQSSEEDNYESQTEESQEDSPQERSSMSENSENEINTYGLQGRYQTINDETESDTNDNYQQNNEECGREQESPQQSPENNESKDEIDIHQKINYYTSPEELDSDDERIREKLRRKRYLRKQNNKSDNNETQNMQLTKQSNTLDKFQNNNNKLYPVTYNNDGINKTATYHSTLDQQGVKGRARFTLHQTKHSKGFHYESRTQSAGTNQPSIEENGEERYQRLEVEERLPEITMGTFYIDEYEDDDLSVEDENNNYLIDPETIDLTKEDINPEAMGMEKINGTIQWISRAKQPNQNNLVTRRQEQPEIRIVSVRGGNEEEHVGETYNPENEVFATTPGGLKHVKTDATGKAGILQALLERASRDSIHSRRQKQEEDNLKEKNMLKEERLHSVMRGKELEKKESQNKEINKENNTNQKLKNKLQAKDWVNKNKNIDRLIEKLQTRIETNKDSQDKRKDKMTIIPKTTIQNLNLTCGGNYILRGEIDEGDISSVETMSTHSSTESQYEKEKANTLPKRRREDIITEEDSLTDSSSDSILEEDDTYQMRCIQQEHNYPKEDQEEGPWRFSKAVEDHESDEGSSYPEEKKKKPNKNNLTSIQKNLQQGEVKSLIKTCKQKKEINETYRRRRNKTKINKKLLPYYYKIKSKIKTYRIYFLKRHVKLLRRVIKNKNIRLADETITDSSKNGATKARTTHNQEARTKDGNVHNEPVQGTDQSESTVIGGVNTRERRQPMSREHTTNILDNRETCNAQVILTGEGQNKTKSEMEREESRLLREYRDKLRKREEEEARRASRIEHLKFLINQIPDVEKIPESEDQRIEEEIDEAERSYNALDESKTIYRITEDVRDRDENAVAQFNATVNLKTDPTRMRADKQGIMAVIIIKDREMIVETKLLGDIDLKTLGHLQIKMAGIGPIELKKQEIQGRGIETTVPRTTETRDERTNVPMERGESPDNTLPEVASIPCPDTIEQEITVQTEGEEENIIPRTPTPQPQLERERRYSMRGEQATKRRYTVPETSEESTSEEEMKETKKRKTLSKKKTEGKLRTSPERQEEQKIVTKTRAKDGRKLLDLTNRDRDKKGRLMGYKPGTEPAKIQRKKKKQSPGDTEKERRKTAETQSSKPRIKMPLILPKLATPQLKVKVRKLVESDTYSPETPTVSALDIPLTPDVSRARSMRPVSHSYPEDRPEGRPEPETQPEIGAPEEETRRDIQEVIPDVEGDELPATQPFYDEDAGEPEPRRPDEEMDTEMGQQ